MSSADTAAPVAVHVVRDGFVESLHRAHVAVATADGAIVASLGDLRLETFPRSALKPFQAAACLGLLSELGLELTPESLAIACASHEGSDAQQIEVAYVLAVADLDESALRCPPALAGDELARAAQRGAPTALAHNCSGKHAAFLYAQTAAGGAPDAYLDVDSTVQRRVVDEIGDACLATPTGPGVDGCGAPAWRFPLSALATGFARLAADAGPLRPVAAAMRARPDLVGGGIAADTLLMAADARVVAKRGAEAVAAAGFHRGDGTFGIAVKVEDGGARAAGPVVASLLEQLGATVPAAVRRPPVLGGGAPHGALVTAPEVDTLLT